MPTVPFARRLSHVAALALVLGGCAGETTTPDDAIVHTDRLGYHSAYWHTNVTAADVRRDVPLETLIPSGATLVDLTHVFDEETIAWPGEASGFRRESSHNGPKGKLAHYAAGSFCTPEHAGTHLDAPAHFARGKATADMVPIGRLMARAVVIDISAKASADRDALLERADVEAFEASHGPISPGTIVMVRTDWSARWNNRGEYLGDGREGKTSSLHFPGIAPEAAHMLVERDVGAVGIDTASIDHGPSVDFAAHRIFAEAQVPTFENVTRLELVPATGGVVLALPMKVGQGSGSPVRIVAVVPR
jgi:kynurenine formamidase